MTWFPKSLLNTLKPIEWHVRFIDIQGKQNG